MNKIIIQRINANASVNPQEFEQLSLPLQSPQEPGELIEKLLECPQLKGWERLFVSTVGQCPKPGARQLEKVRAIATRLGVATEGGET